jgi:hypothetical protein
MFLTVGGMEGLTTYLTKKRVVEPEYSLALNPITKEEYRIYKNGTVFGQDGTIITLEGLKGLTKYIQEI